MLALNEDPSYLSTLSKSVVLHLSEFYSQLKFIPISAKVGLGIEETMNHLLS